MTLRRRLLVITAPVAVLLVIVVVKSASVVIAGSSAPASFADGDAGALRGDVATLNVLNVLEPAKAPFAAGGLAVLDGRLDDAVDEFSTSLSRTAAPQSCPVRVNLQLVQETLGDNAFAVFNGRAAADWYLRASTVVADAPSGCFAGNDDPDEQRRLVREDAARRLAEKLAAAQTPPPPPPPPAAPVTAPPPPPVGSAPGDRDTRLRLDPNGGDPLERLQQILRDAAAARGRRTRAAAVTLGRWPRC